MIKKCPGCKQERDMKSNQVYCNKKCKKTYENSLRSAPRGAGKKEKAPSINAPSHKINRPQHLNEIAAAYWDKVAPTVMERGHLNILSEDSFAELCDIHSRLIEVNKAIDETNRSLLQVVDQWDNKNGIESQQFKESALSDLKRKYSRQFLDYCKAFYLTPLSNRGNFGLAPEGPVDPEEDFLSMGNDTAGN